METMINLKEDIEQREIPGFHGRRGGTLFILSILFVSIAAVLVAIRVSTRLATKRELGKDDHFILLATVHLFILFTPKKPFTFFSLTEIFFSKVFDIGLTIVNCVCKLLFWKPQTGLMNADESRSGASRIWPQRQHPLGRRSQYCASSK